MSSVSFTLNWKVPENPNPPEVTVIGTYSRSLDPESVIIWRASWDSDDKGDPRSTPPFWNLSDLLVYVATSLLK